MIVADSVMDLIGKTPLLRINRLTQPNDAAVYAKLEWYNIGGSVKDRMALYLMEYAEAAGKLSGDKPILEATSGNTGIALAMIAAAKGYQIHIIMPRSASIERRKMITAYGAQLTLSPAENGTSGAIELKQHLLKKLPHKYTDLDQFKDPANILAHYQTTGKEILTQTRGKVDAIVVGVGTSGTGGGISMRVKSYRPEIQIIGVMPCLGVRIEGLRNPREPCPTQLYRRKHYDEIIEITKEEVLEAFDVAQRAAREEGLLVGKSAAVILYVALRKARELKKNKMIVAVLPDSGEKYLSTSLLESQRRMHIDE